jgi:hypothetical protein
MNMFLWNGILMQIRTFEYFTGVPDAKFKAELYKRDTGGQIVEYGWGPTKEDAIREAVIRLKVKKGLMEYPDVDPQIEMFPYGW